MAIVNPPIPPALADTLARASRVTVFTGAGVSAESGIATFRDPLTGLWSRFDAQALATPEAFAAQPDLVWGLVRVAPGAGGARRTERGPSRHRGARAAHAALTLIT
ncbi:silent information regulator protein Sir2, partial [Achromobacter xylosoxidans C54]